MAVRMSSKNTDWAYYTLANGGQVCIKTANVIGEIPTTFTITGVSTRPVVRKAPEPATKADKLIALRASIAKLEAELAAEITIS